MSNNIQKDKHNNNIGKKRALFNNSFNNNLKGLFEIFTVFFKIGAFTFGGGYAMIPLIEREVVNNKGWVNTDEIVDFFAICESVPGAIAINSATLIGYKTAGKKGALAATIGVVLPSLLIITVIAAFFARFQDIPMVKAAFAGVRAAVVALIVLAAIKIGKASVKDTIGVIIALVSVIFVAFLNIHAIFIIIGGAALGLAIYVFYPKKIILASDSSKKKSRDKN